MRKQNLWRQRCKKINTFFTEARKKAIWKGFINDVDQSYITLKEIIAFFHGKIDPNDEEILANNLEANLPEKFNTKSTDFQKRLETAKTIIHNTLRTFSMQDFDSFLQRKIRYEYNSLKWGEVKPIQIAIRAGASETLLKDIKENYITIFQDDLIPKQKRSTDKGTKREIITKNLKEKIEKKIEENLMKKETEDSSKKKNSTP
ncbi:hypothetical protein [Fibrobacter sp. UWH4]|uniref:hypothetical protein n=1 Tax=Fibrobacter sp. UWH4 TaxID=1896210 RepID=UPI00091CAEA1|nr:hypothetical protein [Fibrobacter sp. UWH4]SHL83224.1 hypothetical protein SAMN05720762_1175 [Fibrobacter sp. UWH4]